MSMNTVQNSSNWSNSSNMSFAVQQRVANQRHFIILIVTSRCIWHIPACIDALAKPGVSANDSVHSLDMHTIHIYISYSMFFAEAFPATVLQW